MVNSNIQSKVYLRIKSASLCNACKHFCFCSQTGCMLRKQASVIKHEWSGLEPIHCTINYTQWKTIVNQRKKWSWPIQLRFQTIWEHSLYVCFCQDSPFFWTKPHWVISSSSLSWLTHQPVLEINNYFWSPVGPN